MFGGLKSITIFVVLSITNNKKTNDMETKKEYNLNNYTGLELKDIAREKGIKLEYNTPTYVVIELLNKLNK